MEKTAQIEIQASASAEAKAGLKAVILAAGAQAITASGEPLVKTGDIRLIPLSK